MLFEAAADRVMHLWSMTTLPSDDELAVLRDTVMEELSKQHHLGESDLVIAGLNASECRTEEMMRRTSLARNGQRRT
jgi:hypothetical protein